MASRRAAVRAALILLTAGVGLLALAGAAEALPDLFASVIVPAGTVDGDAAAVNVTVGNAGNATASSFNVTLSIDGVETTRASVSSLASGGLAYFAFPITWACGHHNATAAADPENTVVEDTDADNNETWAVHTTAAARFTMVRGGELGLYNLTVDASASSGCGGLTFSWDAWPAGTHTGANVTFDVPAGNITVILLATVPSDHGLSGVLISSIDIPNAPPVIQSASLPDESVNTGKTIDLLVLAYDSDGSVTSVYADFDDGHTATGLAAISDYAYTRPGNYTILLRVTDNLGATTELNVSIGALNRPPIARAVLKYIYVEAGEEADFDATPSSDPEGGPLTFMWEFDDGSTVLSAMAIHVYASPGTHEATLTVADEFGATSNLTIAVNVVGGSGGGGASALFAVLGLGMVAVAALFYLRQRRLIANAPPAAPPGGPTSPDELPKRDIPSSPAPDPGPALPRVVEPDEPSPPSTDAPPPSP